MLFDLTEMLAEANDFCEPSQLFNLTLLVEEKKLFFNKDLLASYSPVFNRMLYGDFAESKTNEISLPDKRFSEIQDLLRCLYPMPHTKDITDDNIDAILKIADEYQISDLTHRSARHIKLNWTNSCAKIAHGIVLAVKVLVAYSS